MILSIYRIFINKTINLLCEMHSNISFSIATHLEKNSFHIHKRMVTWSLEMWTQGPFQFGFFFPVFLFFVAIRQQNVLRLLHLGFYSMHLSFWLWGRDCWQLGFTASWMAEKICCVFQSDLYYRSQILYFSPNLQHNYTTDSWNLMEAGGSLVVFFSSVTT